MKKIIASSLFSLLLVLPFTALAVTKSFGGKVTVVTFCTCSLNFMVTISTPTPGIFIYNPYSTVPYMYYSFLVPSAWILGNAALVPTPCMQYAGVSCTPQAFGLPMIMVGSSSPGV